MLYNEYKIVVNSLPPPPPVTFPPCHIITIKSPLLLHHNRYYITVTSQVLQRNPIALTQVAYSLVRLLDLQGGVALGLFAAGCAPGGGASNVYTYLLGGDVNLSVTMTLVSTSPRSVSTTLYNTV